MLNEHVIKMASIEVKTVCSKCDGTGHMTAFLDPKTVCKLCIDLVLADVLKHDDSIRKQCQRRRFGYEFSGSCPRTYCIHKAVYIKTFAETKEYCSEFCSKV